MSEVVKTILRGVYLPMVLFGAIGLLVRVRRRSWHGMDVLCGVGFLIYECLAACQTWMFYGVFSTSKRYMWIGVVLLLPLAGVGALALWRRVASTKTWRRWAVLCACLLWAGSLCHAFSPVLSLHTKPSRRLERAFSMSAARWIQADWKGSAGEGLSCRCCDQYLSRKRPLVKSELDRIGFLCGGQNYTEIFSGYGVCPDYLVSFSLQQYGGFRLVHTVMISGHFVYIYKRIPTQSER